MARDLHELMADALARGTGALADTADDGDRVARLRAAVRRRRTKRAVVRGTSAACVAVVVAGASWFGLRAVEDPTPAVTPSPSVTVETPSPTPTASPTATPSAPAKDQILGLPPTRALPPGLLERTTPGWVLSLYASMPAFRETELDWVPNGVVNAVVLSSPDGELYRVVDLPEGMGVSLLHWDAGSTTAAVSVDWAGDLGQGTEPRAQLDLLTGAITALPITPPAPGTAPGGWYYEGRRSDGSELWSTPTSTDAVTSDLFVVADDGTATALTGIGSTMFVSPTGTRAISEVWGTGEGVARFSVVDLGSGEVREYELVPSGRSCTVVEWLGPDQVLLFCLDSTTSDATYSRLDVVGQTYSEEVLDVGAGAPHPVGRAASVAPGVVALVGTHAGPEDEFHCGDDIYLMTAAGEITPASPSPLSAAGILRSREGTLTFASTDGCALDFTSLTISAVDVASGDTTVLAPPPPVTAEVPEWDWTITSWVVGD